MPLEPDAQREILLLWNRMEQEKVRQFCENDAMCAWASKAHGKASRLAGLLALLENPDATTVSQKAAKAAVAMMEEYFIPHAVRAFEMPDYHYKGKTLEEIQWEKEAEEDNGLPF